MIVLFPQAKLKMIFHHEAGFELYDPQKDVMDGRVLKFLSKEQAWENLAFPLNQPDAEKLVVLMADPTHEETIRSLQSITNKRLKILVAEKDCIQELVLKYYNDNRMKNEKTNGRKSEASPEPSIIALVNQLIAEGVSQGASDIHIEAFPKKIQVRYRIDGILQLRKLLDAKTLQGIISRLKILGGCDIAEHRLPQDGAFTSDYEGRQIDVRLSIMPTIHGEKIVLTIA